MTDTEKEFYKLLAKIIRGEISNEKRERNKNKVSGVINFNFTNVNTIMSLRK